MLSSFVIFFCLIVEFIHRHEEEKAAMFMSAELKQRLNIEIRKRYIPDISADLDFDAIERKAINEISIESKVQKTDKNIMCIIFFLLL